MISQERQHGEIVEHIHDGYEYWHPITRIHKESNLNNLPADHVVAPVILYSEELETPRGLQVKPFDWKAWDANCHAKGICQGYHSIPVQVYVPQDGTEPEIGIGLGQQLHHRAVAPELQGIAEQYWQCPHCKQLQKPIQWAQGARLETYYIARRGNRTVLWLQVSSGQWFVLIAARSIQIVAGNECGLQGTAYAVWENRAPLQLPEEIAIALARRFWHKITKGYWSDAPKEGDE